MKTFGLHILKQKNWKWEYPPFSKMTVSVIGISIPIDIFSKKKKKGQRRRIIYRCYSWKWLTIKCFSKKTAAQTGQGPEEDRRRGSARLEPALSSGAGGSPLQFSSPPRPPPSLRGPRSCSPCLPCTCRGAVPPASELNSRKKSSAPTRHLAQRKRGEMVMPRRLRRRREDRHWSAGTRNRRLPSPLRANSAIAENEELIPASEEPALPFTRAPFSSLSTALTPMNLCLLVPLAAGEAWSPLDIVFPAPVKPSLAP